MVLDFFAGSATTAQAILELNAEDGSDRRFILVQMPETLEEKARHGSRGIAPLQIWSGRVSEKLLTRCKTTQMKKSKDWVFSELRTVTPGRRWDSSHTDFTSSRNFEDWGAILGDKAMASAIIDRIVHHAHILKFSGDSYRIKDFLTQLNNID